MCWKLRCWTQFQQLDLLNISASQMMIPSLPGRYVFTQDVAEHTSPWDWWLENWNRRLSVCLWDLLPLYVFMHLTGMTVKSYGELKVMTVKSHDGFNSGTRNSLSKILVLILGHSSRIRILKIWNLTHCRWDWNGRTFWDLGSNHQVVVVIKTDDKLIF